MREILTASLKERKNDSGFGMLELIVVIAILGIITSVTVMNTGDSMDSSREGNVEAAAEQASTSAQSAISKGQDPASAIENSDNLRGDVEVSLISEPHSVVDEVCVEASWAEYGHTKKSGPGCDSGDFDSVDPVSDENEEGNVTPPEEEEETTPPHEDGGLIPDYEGIMVTQWDLNKERDHGLTVNLPISDDFEGVVNWGGHGTENSKTSYTYDSADDYEITVRGDFNSWGTPLFSNRDLEGLVEVSEWKDTKTTDLSGAFLYSDVTHVEEIPENVNNMHRMFAGATSFQQDIGHWDVSNVVYMNDVFRETSLFNHDLSGWDMGNAITTQAMFFNSKVFNQDVSNWDVSNVQNMNGMFNNASSFDNGGQPLDWGEKTSQVKDMRWMFQDGIFNQEVNSWNTSNVELANSIFRNNPEFNQPLNNWDVSKLTSLSSMFRHSSSFDQDLSSWNIPEVDTMRYMFWDATEFNNGGETLDWNTTSNLTSTRYMFGGASNFNQDVSSWDVSSVTTMNSMFSNASAFNNGGEPLDWGEMTSEVFSVSYMFQNANSFNQDISGWNLSSATNDADFIPSSFPDEYMPNFP